MQSQNELVCRQIHSILLELKDLLQINKIYIG